MEYLLQLLFVVSKVFLCLRQCREVKRLFDRKNEMSDYAVKQQASQPQPAQSNAAHNHRKETADKNLPCH